MQVQIDGGVYLWWERHLNLRRESVHRRFIADVLKPRLEKLAAQESAGDEGPLVNKIRTFADRGTGAPIFR